MLTDSQRNAYLEKLGLESALAPTRENLDRLIYAHQTTIPFSTVEMHRAQKTPNLATDAIYRKVVIEGKGGYCFELNKLFQELLNSLGYDARPVVCRAVRGRSERMPINHRGTLVALEEGDFSADVGFGGPMPAGALQLIVGVEQGIRGESYCAEPLGQSWWAIDRFSSRAPEGSAGACADGRAGSVHDRSRQTELELCTATMEDIDFESLNRLCSQPGSLFRDHEVVNMRTEDGYRGYRDGVLTLRQGDDVTVSEPSTDEERNRVLRDCFGLRCV